MHDKISCIGMYVDYLFSVCPTLFLIITTMIITVTTEAMTPIITSAPKLPNNDSKRLSDPFEYVSYDNKVVKTCFVDVLIVIFSSEQITPAVCLQSRLVPVNLKSTH